METWGEKELQNAIIKDLNLTTVGISFADIVEKYQILIGGSAVRSVLWCMIANGRCRIDGDNTVHLVRKGESSDAELIKDALKFGISNYCGEELIPPLLSAEALALELAKRLKMANEKLLKAERRIAKMNRAMSEDA